MALLQSLEICGIRSFSPETKETIVFNTPVTLFLGQNGCGKTTIIECIRYALTSELPSGSSNGQGFLNDPKMTQKSQVKGSVKIKFQDAKGDMITVSRFMSVTTKAKGALTFKNLMPNIRKRDKNNPEIVNDVSGRCIDIDNYCCSALNVSKSIINNVLFCHQENSSWPLDEPKKLKDKFDEIFDAVKYNKCVEAVRKYIKQKRDYIKRLKERLEHKETIKDEIEKQRGKLLTKQKDLSAVVDQINEKEIQINPFEQRFKEVLDLEDTLADLQRSLHGKQTERKGIIDQQSTIKKHITYTFEGTDEELKDKINFFCSEQATEKNAILGLEKKKNEISDNISDINVNMQRIQVKVGQFKEEQKQHTKKAEECQTLIQKLRLELELNAFSDINDRNFVMKAFQNALKLIDDNYNSFVKKNDLQEKQLQNKIDQTREEYAAAKQQLSSKGKLIVDIKNKLKDIKEKLEELDSSDSQVRIVERAIEDYRATLTKLKKSFDEHQMSQEIENLKENVCRKEQLLEKLDKEYRVQQQNYAKEQQLESERNSLMEKQREINRIRNKHKENLFKMFREQIPDKNLKNAIIGVQNNADVDFKSITQKINQFEKEITTLETTITHIKNKLLTDKNALSTKQNTICQVCKGNDFYKVLKECSERKEKLQKKKGELSSGKFMYECFISKFEKESPCCPICETDFKNKGTVVQKIIKTLKEKIVQIPAELKQVEAFLKKEESLYNKLQQLQTVNNDVNKLRNETIPAMETEIATLTVEKEEKQLMLAEEKANLTQPQEMIEISKTIVADAALFDQHNIDVKKTTECIENLERSIVKVSSNRSRQETEAEIDIIKAELSNLKNKLDSNKKILDQHKDRCHKLNMNIQDEVQKKINIEKLIQEKPLLEIQCTEYFEKQTTVSTEIQELNDILETRKKDLQTAESEKLDIVSRNRAANEKERNRIILLKNTLKDIQKLHQNMEIYTRNETDKNLDNALEELAKLNLNLKKMDETKTNILEAISNKKEILAKKETEFRALEDNVTLREKQKAEIKLSAEILELEKNIGGYNYRSVYEEKKQLQKNIDKITKEISNLNGQRAEMKKHILDLKTYLNEPQNKNAYNNYKKQYYELRLEEFLVEDLDKYIRVLERSILKFHEERMIQINITIRELWRSIYRGNDIDYIEIKTDDHMTGGANRKRTYNYKVIQVKNNVKLEMRGRCSAGQKVLACLVIRMALAETFSSHCGILALDEPTTNLDRENINSLSDSLAKIISHRENQSNFQLLIITHDEDFLNNLTGMQHFDTYWKVQRNRSGFSTVTKEYVS